MKSFSVGTSIGKEIGTWIRVVEKIGIWKNRELMRMWNAHSVAGKFQAMVTHSWVLHSVWRPMYTEDPLWITRHSGLTRLSEELSGKHFTDRPLAGDGFTHRRVTFLVFTNAPGTLGRSFSHSGVHTRVFTREVFSHTAHVCVVNNGQAA